MGSGNDRDQKNEKNVENVDNTADDQTEKTVETDRANLNTVIIDGKVTTADIESQAFR